MISSVSISIDNFFFLDTKVLQLFLKSAVPNYYKNTANQILLNLLDILIQICLQLTQYRVDILNRWCRYLILQLLQPIQMVLIQFLNLLILLYYIIILKYYIKIIIEPIHSSWFTLISSFSHSRKNPTGTLSHLQLSPHCPNNTTRSSRNSFTNGSWTVDNTL